MSGWSDPLLGAQSTASYECLFEQHFRAKRRKSAVFRLTEFYVAVVKEDNRAMPRSIFGQGLTRFAMFRGEGHVLS